MEVHMALKQSKKDKIIAEAKAGRFKNVTELCEKHKISRKTYYQLEKSNNFKFGDNVGIVEASLLLEQAKSNKKVTEIRAIEQTVKERISTIEIDTELVANNRKIAKLIQAKIVANKDEIDLRTIKNVTGAIKDIEAIANPKDNGKVEVNTQVNTQINEIKVTFE